MSKKKSNQDIISEIKKKKEFSGLPDSIVSSILKKIEDTLDFKSKVKEARSFLRKYFGVFVTNRIIKKNNNAEEVLKSHISSKKRDYDKFYSEIFSEINNVGSVIDLGCGVNGFSYFSLQRELEDVEYCGIEAISQIVENSNDFFKKNNINKAKIYCADLFEIDKIKSILHKAQKNRVVFLLQVIDALEFIEKDFSKKLLLELKKNSEYIVISLPVVSLSGKSKFLSNRNWLIDFLSENFKVVKDFTLNQERIIVLNNKI